MPLTIAAMTAEIRENNIAKGWRSAAGGPGSNTLGDYISLLHTEGAEATEAFRDHRLNDATANQGDCYEIEGTGMCASHHQHASHCKTPVKPEGVGSEFGDMAIRLFDTGDVFGFQVCDPDFELDDIADLYPMLSDPDLPDLVSFADHMAWLHRRIDRMWTDTTTAPAWALRALVTVARKYGVDLEFEYTRKMAYNRSRPHRHGGRALTDTNA